MDIRRACDGAKEAENAAAEVATQGARGGALKRGLEGAIDESLYGGFVEEDVDRLLKVYRAHPDALYGTKPMKFVMLDAAADLGNGSCDDSQAERIRQEVGLASGR